VVDVEGLGIVGFDENEGLEFYFQIEFLEGWVLRFGTICLIGVECSCG
jgi:predicted acetyltransferase